MGEPSFIDFIILFVLLPIFFLPIIIAWRKKHPHRIPITLVNILLGFFYGLGWVVALIWCFIDPVKTQVLWNDKSPLTNNVEEIKKLHQLKEENIISQEEFEIKKRELLNLDIPENSSRL